MLKKTFRFLANILLVFLPFFPVLENFFSTVNHENLPSYLMACGALGVFIILLLFFLYNSSDELKNKHKLDTATWLLCILGMMVMVPLHMGPPKESEALLASAIEEKFRYIMLILAIILFVVAIVLIIKRYWSELTVLEKAILIPLLITIPISIWDNYDSIMFSTKLNAWIATGKHAIDFFPNYDFHHTWRAVGRILLYVVAGWLSIILVRRFAIKRWVTVILILFCIIGIGCCITFLFHGFAFYFPFMVPAIALAPSYWLGLALLNRFHVEAK